MKTLKTLRSISFYREPFAESFPVRIPQGGIIIFLGEEEEYNYAHTAYTLSRTIKRRTRPCLTTEGAVWLITELSNERLFEEV